jgi:hypothetical protein
MYQRLLFVVAISIVSTLRAVEAVQAADPPLGLAFSTLCSTPSSYVALNPCRVVDTRGNGFGGAYGPPALAVGSPRTFVMAGQCGIPSNAQAVVINFAVILPAAQGFLTAYPSGAPVPLVSSVNFVPGQVTSNGAILPLGDSGGITVFTGGAGANTNLVIDVNGYFVAPPTSHKVCSVANGSTFRDNTTVPDSWVASDCAAWRDVVLGNASGFYNLVCIFDSGGNSWGPNNGGPPATNCGW